MGITALTFSVGKTLKPGQSQKVIGVLTAIYGVGQILGHLVSGIYRKMRGVRVNKQKYCLVWYFKKNYNFVSTCSKNSKIVVQL